jgi:hypothetical protein
MRGIGTGDGAAAREALTRDIDDAEIALRGLIRQA